MKKATTTTANNLTTIYKIAKQVKQVSNRTTKENFSPILSDIENRVKAAERKEKAKQLRAQRLSETQEFLTNGNITTKTVENIDKKSLVKLLKDDLNREYKSLSSVVKAFASLTDSNAKKAFEKLTGQTFNNPSKVFDYIKVHNVTIKPTKTGNYTCGGLLNALERTL